MMTKPDLTNTAPKRIYLDIGDQFALERVLSGGLSWQALDGVTWSEDNATSHGIPYVRADLVPTPAASRALPALPRYAEWVHLGTHGQWSNLVPSWAKDHNGLMNDTVAARAVIDELAAALASREASPATLTDERIAELWIEHGLDEDDPEGFARIIEREIGAALASPQVAPAPDERMRHIANEWADMATNGLQWVRNIAEGISTPQEALENLTSNMQHCSWVNDAPATPVQVAPPNLSSPLAGDCRTVGGFLSDVMTAAGLVEHGRQCKPLAERISVACSDLRARIFQGSAPVAPQDDARDAAEAARDEGFTAGTIAAMAVIFAFDQETMWAEILNAAGREKVLQHAAHIEPDAWKWAGFRQYLGKKPRRAPAAKPTEPTLPTLPTLPTQGDAK